MYCDCDSDFRFPSHSSSFELQITSFVDALNSLRTTFEHTYVKVVHQTDTARATVMAADPTILALPTFPEHHKDWADWEDAALDKKSKGPGRSRRD